MTTKKRALDVQEGGNHYKKMPIQPVEYCYHNKLGVCESNIIKYVTRWRDKNGIQDLEKARHYIDLLIEFAQAEQVAESSLPTEDTTASIDDMMKQYRDLEKPWEWQIGDYAEVDRRGETLSGTISNIFEGDYDSLVFQLDGVDGWFLSRVFNKVEFSD